MLTRYFQVEERGSDVRTEVRGGVATFFTMAYIVVLNPLILAAAADVTGRRLDIAEVASSTALVAAAMTILMGVVGRYPLAVAAGLGLNGVVAFQLAAQMSWADAMGVVVLEGLVITALVLLGVRQSVFAAVPLALKNAIAVGIGLFIAFIGFVDAGFVRRVPDAANSPVPVGLGIGGRLVGWPTLVFVVGLLVTIVLVARRVRAAILLSIVGTTLFAIALNAAVDVGAQPANPRGWSLNVPKFPDKLVSAPDFGLVGDFSLGGSFAAVGAISALLFVFTLMLADFFDTMGTVVGVGAQGDLLDDDGELPGAGPVLLVDSLAAVAGGAASASSNTTYIESAAGVGDGARTGLASVVTGLLFVAALFFTPLVSVVPVRGGVARPGGRRLPPHDPGQGHRLGRLHGGHPRLPHHRPHAVHVLDHQRDRRRLRLLRGDQTGERPGTRCPSRCCGWWPPCSSCTSGSSGWSS